MFWIVQGCLGELGYGNLLANDELSLFWTYGLMNGVDGIGNTAKGSRTR
jgi:hypothetical protein